MTREAFLLIMEAIERAIQESEEAIPPVEITLKNGSIIQADFYSISIFADVVKAEANYKATAYIPIENISHIFF